VENAAIVARNALLLTAVTALVESMMMTGIH
jgi:hypothetical protein